MRYVASQYSLIENLHLFAHLEYVESSEILRPDGSPLISFDAEHQWYPNILVDELNSLLVLPDHHVSTFYDEFPVLTVCNKCGEAKKGVRFQGKYTGYECTDCQPF